MDPGQLTIEKRHGLRKWVEKTEDWPADRWDGVVGTARELCVNAQLEAAADDSKAIIGMIAILVLKRPTFINYFLGEERKYYPEDDAEWQAIAEVVACILVQRYYRETHGK